MNRCKVLQVVQVLVSVWTEIETWSGENYEIIVNNKTAAQLEKGH